MMLGLNFEGWSEVRLATNPDPTDELRGVSGYSFALAGEPDFDRVIRFHEPVCPRSFAPEVGVFVKSVTLNGTVDPAHVLTGAPVVLLNKHDRPPVRPRDPDGPKFEARDYILTQPGDQPIDPFHIHIARDDVAVSRKAVLWPGHEDKPIWEIPNVELVKFGSISFILGSADVAEATGIVDLLGYRAERRGKVEKQLQEEKAKPHPDSTLMQALTKRFQELERDIEYPGDRRVGALSACETRNFNLTGAAQVVDPHSKLGGVPTTTDSKPWMTEFWFGAWDCDALTAYVKGTLVIPFEQQ